MKRRTIFATLLLVVLLGALALLSPSCDGCTCPLTSTELLSCSDGSEVTLNAGTDISPCNCMSATWIAPGELPDQACLPAGNVITAIDVTPNGVQFSPDGLLHYALPNPALYAVGTWLTIWQHTSGTCGGGSSNWIPEPSHATVVAGGFADGPLRHTSIFALVDMSGRIGTLGRLVTPFTQQDGDIVFDVEVLVFSTRPDLEGTVLTIVVAGIEGDPAGFLAGLAKIPVGAEFAFQFDDESFFTVWWEDSIIQFYAQDVQIG